MAATNDGFEEVWNTLVAQNPVLPTSLNATTSLATLAAGATALPTRTIPTLPHLSLHIPTDDAPTIANPASSSADIEVLRVLGEGGMGKVYLARQRSMMREVALKTLKHAVEDAQASEAILSEGVITGYLEHPNIIPIHLLGLDASRRPVMVMKRVDGVGWDVLLNEPEHPAWSRVLNAQKDRRAAHIEILIQVCTALHYAHNRGVIHRDIKPENVMIGEFGEVYLVDWGVALRKQVDVASGPSGLVGTPVFMAPEMLEGNPNRITPATDVFLLGATLHNVLTGRFRHEGSSLPAVIHAAFLSEPVDYDASVPEDLAALCNQATSRNPADRPESALAFRQALTNHLAHRGSNELSHSATESLDRLRALLSEGSSDSAKMAQLASEARFGFNQALKQWNENPHARAGLQRCLETLVEMELSRENLDGARMIASEFLVPNPSVEERLQSLARTLEHKKQEAERLRALAYDLDASVGVRQRSYLFLGLAVLALIIGGSVVSAQFFGRDAFVSSFTLVRVGAILLAVVLPSVYFLRRSLLANEYNRRVVWVLLAALCTLFLHRFAGWKLGLATPHILVVDNILLTGSIAVGTAAFLQHAWPVIPVSVLISLVGVYYPRASFVLFGINAFWTAFGLGVIWQRPQKSSANKRP